MPETPEQAQTKRAFNPKMNFLAGKGKFTTKSAPTSVAESVDPEASVPDAPVRTGFNFRHPAVKKQNSSDATLAEGQAEPAREDTTQAPSTPLTDVDKPMSEAQQGTSSTMFRNSLAGSEKASTSVSYRGLAPEKEEPALEAERLPIDERNYFQNKVAVRELRVTASAAKSLTRLFAALSLEPGSGAEVPADIRRDTLNDLIRESHVLADQLCQAVMQDPNVGAPDFLRAKLLQGAADFISKQWVEHGRIDTAGLLEMAQLGFSGGSDSLGQDVVDLFGIAEEFTPATSQEISDGRITESVLRETWSMIRQIEDFNVSDYDPDGLTQEGEHAFSYGREPAQVATDLMKTALSIVSENRLEVSNLDLYTNFMQNSIRRASTLVRAEYKMMTDRALRSAFLENLYSEAALSNLNNLYPQIVEKIASRARNSFIRVERSAIEAMSAASYRHYLPKVEKAMGDHAVEKTLSENEAVADIEPQSAKNTKFFFKGPRNANA